MCDSRCSDAGFAAESVIVNSLWITPTQKSYLVAYLFQPFSRFKRNSETTSSLLKPNFRFLAPQHYHPGWRSATEGHHNGRNHLELLQLQEKIRVSQARDHALQSL